MELKISNLRRDNKQRKKKPGRLRNVIAFSGALLGATVMGCGTVDRPLPQVAPLEQTEMGSKTKPYEIYLSKGKEKCGVGLTEVVLPLELELDGKTFHFDVHLPVSKLKDDVMWKTHVEIANNVINMTSRIVSPKTLEKIYSQDYKMYKDIRRGTDQLKKMLPEIEHYLEISSRYELPKQIPHGEGSIEWPYYVILESNREKAGTGSQKIALPIIFDAYEVGVRMRVIFLVDMALSQLKKENRSDTIKELNSVMRRAAEKYAADNCIETGGKIYVSIGRELRAAIDKLAYCNCEIGRYLKGLPDEEPALVEPDLIGPSKKQEKKLEPTLIEPKLIAPSKKQEKKLDLKDTL